MKFSDLQEWSGRVADLLKAAEAVEANQEAIPMTTMRFYQAHGVVGRGRKEKGNRSVFGEREVLELVVARRFVKDGWPIAKLSQIVPGLPVEKLRDIASGLAPGAELKAFESLAATELNPAEALVVQFMSASAAGPGPATEGSMFFGVSSPASTGALGSAKAVHRKALASSAPAALSGFHYDKRSEDIVANERASFSFGPGGWLSVVLDPLHPSFEETSEPDAFKQLESAYKAAEQRLKTVYANTKSRL